MSPIHRHPPQAAPVVSPQQLGALRRKLLHERERIVSDYHRDLAAAQSIQEEGAEDLEELASMDLDREFLFARSEEDRDTLLLIEEALDRMDEGTFGVCQLTGEPIPLARLRLIPWARYRADVQERLEARNAARSGPWASPAYQL